jgi:hypothetical protein
MDENIFGYFSMNRIGYLINQSHLIHTVCRRSGLPRHTDAPERSLTLEEPA